MSDTEEQEQQQQPMDEEPQDVEEAEIEPEEELTAEVALMNVLKTSLHHDGLARGLNESVKALDRREAHLCILANSCNEQAYVKLITALCKEHNIPLLKAEDGKQLGEWAGLCRYNAEGKAVKVVGASVVVVKAWGEDTPSRQFITNLLNGVA
jgi:small subunit ribosomal protein S12e